MPKSKKETTKELVKFDIENAVIVALDTKYKDIKITDGKSYALVMAGIGAYRDLRLSVVDGHKEAKDDALKECQFLDSEKRRILQRLAPGEDRLKAIRQAWDDEKERIKQEKIRIEQERKEAIQVKIAKIRLIGVGLYGKNLEDLRKISVNLEELEINAEGFEEYADEAQKVLNEIYDSVQDTIATAIKLEKQDTERKAEDARLELIRQEQEAVQAKLDEAQKKINDEKAMIAAEKGAEALRKEREEFERQAKEKAEAAAAQKVLDVIKETDKKKEAEAKEKERKAEMAPDKEKLIKFANDILDIPNMRSFTTQKAREIAGWGIGQLGLLSDGIKSKAEEL